jgi:DNA-binding IclR family transcriptional regulator
MHASALSDRQREALETLSCRVTELSRKLGVSKSTASRLLKNLMKKGLVHKNEDKKIFELTLTGKILLRIAKIKASSLIA